MSFSGSGVLELKGVQTISGTRLDWSKSGGIGEFRNTPYDNVSGLLDYGSVYIYPNYRMDIREEIWNPDQRNYRRTRRLLILNESGGIIKQYLLDENSYEISHPIPLEPAFYWAYTYATLKTNVYKKIDYVLNFILFSGNPPGYMNDPIPLDPSPPPPPPPPVCDVKIGIDENINPDGYFCMSFEEFDRFKQNNKRAEENLDTTINVLQGLN